MAVPVCIRRGRRPGPARWASLPPVLHDRLKGLSQIMGLSTEGVIRQALTEFCDTWEDHHRTVSALADTGDRMQIVQRD